MRASVTGGRTAASSAGATLPARSARPSGTIRRGLPTPVNCRKASALTSLETGTSVPSRERAPRVPLLRVERGQQRSLTSPSAEYPQVCISARQQLDHRPTFQAGHAGFDSRRPLRARVQSNIRAPPGPGTASGLGDG
jgi:hypothetical protein